MNFKPNPDYIPVKKVIYLAGFPSIGPIKVELDWAPDYIPSREEIRTFASKTTMSLGLNNTLHEMYGYGSTFAELQYDYEF